MGLLDGKVVVISGVGPGMGQRMAHIAAREGAKVGIGARHGDFLESVARDIRAEGGEAVAVATDVTDAAQCRRLAKETEKAFGPITGLVNAAYVHGEWKPVDVVDAEDYTRIYNVNCVGALRMAQACLPSLKRAGGGAIVNVSTMCTVKPFSGEAGYAAAKGGLNVITRHLAQDLGRFNIRVNLTRMGWIGGKVLFDNLDRQVAAGADRAKLEGEITGRIALGVIPPEEDCAKAVLFFLSDFSKVVSGASLDVNGGEYMAP